MSAGSTSRPAAAPQAKEINTRSVQSPSSFSQQSGCFWSLLDSFDEAVCVIDPASHELVYVNAAFKRIWGDCVGDKCYRVMEDLNSPCPFCRNGQILADKTGRSFVSERRIGKTGRWYHCIERAIPWCGDQRAKYTLAIDITERKRLEGEVVTISAAEHRRIGQELHDVVGQELTGLGYLAETLYGQLRSRGAPEAPVADRLACGIQEALDQVRTIARGLVPVDIGGDGLVPALRHLAADTQRRCGFTCCFHCPHPTRINSPAEANHLYCIAREAVTNAAKHARTRHVAIELVSEDHTITLRVRDDGVGITSDAPRSPGLGLRIMHHRADVIGATLELRRGETRGTIVTCTCTQDQCRDDPFDHQDRHEQVPDSDRR